MALAKCVFTELDGTTVHEYTPLSATVKFEGSKKPDTFEAIFPMQNIVRENFEIAYVQDVVDLTYLKAVYPMQLSCLDESGYDQDPTTDPVETRFANVTIGKFKGHYALEFTADGQGIHVTTVDKIDLTKQFDISIWCTPNPTQLLSGNNEPIIWSFHDATQGLDIGISEQHDSIWRVFVRVDGTSLPTGYRGSTEIVMTGSPVLIRCKRGMDNVLKVYVNGIQESLKDAASAGSPVWNGVISSTLQPTGTDMVFGDTAASTVDEYVGQIHEVRVYCGTDLTDGEADRIRWVKPIAQFMKFAGRVAKIKDVQTTKKALCVSNAYRFTKAKLGGDGTSLIAHDLTAVAFKTILQSAVDVIDDDFTVRNLDSFAETTQISFVLSGSILEVGSFMSFANILFLYSDTVMYMTPRKNIIIETDAGKDTDYVFDQNGVNVKYNIKNSEDNDTKLVNEVILTGTAPATNQTSSFTPTSGIIRTIRRNILPINTSNDLKELADRTRVNLQGDISNDLAPKKYRVQVNTPIPHVRYNMNVTIKRKNGANVLRSLTDQDLNDTSIKVKQIEIYYPNGSTVVKVGENDIDYFDDAVEISITESGLIDSTL